MLKFYHILTENSIEVVEIHRDNFIMSTFHNTFQQLYHNRSLRWQDATVILPIPSQKATEDSSMAQFGEIRGLPCNIRGPLKF